MSKRVAHFIVFAAADHICRTADIGVIEASAVLPVLKVLHTQKSSADEPASKAGDFIESSIQLSICSCPATERQAGVGCRDSKKLRALLLLANLLTG